MQKKTARKKHMWAVSHLFMKLSQAAFMFIFARTDNGQWNRCLFCK